MTLSDVEVLARAAAIEDRARRFGLRPAYWTWDEIPTAPTTLTRLVVEGKVRVVGRLRPGGRGGRGRLTYLLTGSVLDSAKS